jgi:threonine aldolase
VERLSEDHQHAQQIAAALSKKDFTGEIFPVETNIIIFEVKGRITAGEFVAMMKEKDVHMFAISPTHIRMVLHLNITPAMVQETIQIIDQL